MTFSLITIFGAGMLTFLTPCVLPLIPVYLAALTGGNLADMDVRARGQLLFRAGLFSAGFISVFTLMGLGASSIGGFLSDHKTGMQIAGAVLITGFALKFLGLLRIPVLDRVLKADDTRLTTRFGGVNAFVMGIVFAAGWSPCVGPVLGSVLTYTASTTSDPLTGAGYLTLYGLGFALPLLATAGFAELGMKLIRRLSAYLPRIEKGIGGVLLFIAGMLVLDIVQGTGLVAPEAEARAADRATVEAVREPGEPRLPVMLELYKEDCPICQRMKPVVASVTSQCDQKGVVVRTLDVSKPENRHLVQRYRLVGVPTFIFLDENAMEAARLVGEQTEQSLKQTISVLRGEPCPGVAMIDRDAFSYPPEESSNKSPNGCVI